MRRSARSLTNVPHGGEEPSWERYHWPVKKLRLGVVYGGRSGEHEVSVASAASIFKHIDRTRYEPVPVRIEKDGRWTLADRPPAMISAGEVIEHARVQSARSLRSGRDTLMVPYPGDETIVNIDRRPDDRHADETGQSVVTSLGLDVIFPVLHGPYGEDGTIQGLLELANVPYVGAGVMASAVGMDKATMKTLFAARGLPQVAWHAFVRHEWNTTRPAVEAVLATLGFPVFVKPSNLGSSVGITKVRTAGELAPAIELALEFDRKVIVEAGVVNAREIECAVLGNDEPQASLAGEVVPAREFYDYEAKYLDDGSQTIVPASLAPEQMADVQRMAVEAFRAIDAAGMSRVDFFVSRDTGAVYVNEINTIPGFTTISMYAQMWEASGVPYAVLMDRLIQLALDRHAEKQRLRTSVV